MQQQLTEWCGNQNTRDEVIVLDLKNSPMTKKLWYWPRKGLALGLASKITNLGLRLNFPVSTVRTSLEVISLKQ